MQRRTILITGASSGLGSAFARQSAKPGTVLHISGRNQIRLDETAAICRAAGAEVWPITIDVRDSGAMDSWIAGAGPLDMAIANAGVSAGTMGGDTEDDEQIRAIFGINVAGVLNTVLPALRVMKAQAPNAQGIKGRIGVVASVAAFVAAPGAPTYCASKACVDRWTVATAPSAQKQGVSLTSLCPGYTVTPMTDRNRFPMPGIMDPDRIALRMLQAIDKGATRFTAPLWLAAIAKTINLLPSAWANQIMARSAGKDPAAQL